MNLFRDIVASVLVGVILFAGAATALGFALNRTFLPQTAMNIIADTRAGERLTAALPDYLKNNVAIPWINLVPDETFKSLVAAALPAADADRLLRSVSGEVVNYVRGDSATLSKIDLAPIESRAVNAAKKTSPGIVGDEFGLAVAAQFKNAGLEKGIELPRKELDAAKNAFAALRAGTAIVMAVAIFTLLLLFFVAPNKLRGRLIWCAVSLFVSGLATALLAHFLATVFVIMQVKMQTPAASPEVAALVKDVLIQVGLILEKNTNSFAFAYLAAGAVLGVFGLVFGARQAPVNKTSLSQ